MVYNKFHYTKIYWSETMRQILITLLAFMLCMTAHAQTTDSSTNTTCVHPELQWNSTGGMYGQENQTYNNACTTLNACNNLASQEASCCKNQPQGVCCDQTINTACTNCGDDGSYYTVVQKGDLELASKTSCAANERLNQIKNKKYNAEMTFFSKEEAVQDDCNDDDCETKVQQEISDLQTQCQENSAACSQKKTNIEHDASQVKYDTQTVETTAKGDIQTDLQTQCQDNTAACSQDEANIENDASDAENDASDIKGDI